MAFLVDTRNLSCPQPVILTKKALEEHDEVEVLADNLTAIENIKRLAEEIRCSLEIKKENDIYRIFSKRKAIMKSVAVNERILGPLAIVICSDMSSESYF